MTLDGPAWGPVPIGRGLAEEVAARGEHGAAFVDGLAEVFRHRALARAAAASGQVPA